jgi:hypothetical protein
MTEALSFLTPPLLYNHDAIFSRLCLLVIHLVSGFETYAPSVFGDTEMTAPPDILDAWRDI